MVSVVKEARANGSRLSPNLAQSLLWKGLTSSWSVHRSEICKPWCRQARPNQLVLVPLLNQGKKQIIIKDVFHCTGWQQHKPYFGSRLRHTLKGTFQISWSNLTVCLVTLTLVNLLHTWVQEIQRLPQAFSPCRTVHSVYRFSECEQTLFWGHRNIDWKWRLARTLPAWY